MSGRNTQSVQVKVKRYWPGKVPEGADAYSDYSSSGDEAGTKTSDFSKTGKVSARVDEPVVETEQETITIETMNPESIQADRRLQRLQQTKKPTKARDISSRYDQEDKSSADDSGEDDIEDSRARIKREALLRQREIEKTLEVSQEAASEEESEEEESEYTTESSEEEDDMMPMFKPVFVPKSQRVTIFEKERKEAELVEAERLRDLEKQLRKKESAKMVQELIKQELEEAAYKAQAITEADDTDGINEEAEYEAWKLRELMRIKRDVEEKAELAREKAEIERRRNMTEEERTREDLEKVRQQDEAKFERQQNTKQVFLQKYHHKGAFFMDKDEEVYKRNFHEAAESEVFHRELLPQVMQVKNFGLAGRTKYTHLGDQDTTKDSPWNQVDPSVNSTLRKLGGLHDLVEHKVYKAPRRDEDEQGNFNPGQFQGQGNQYQGQGNQYQGQGNQYQGQGSQYQGQNQYQPRPQGQNQGQYQDSRQSRDKK